MSVANLPVLSGFARRGAVAPYERGRPPVAGKTVVNKVGFLAALLRPIGIALAPEVSRSIDVWFDDARARLVQLAQR